MKSAYRQIHAKRIYQKNQKQLRTLFVEHPPSLLNFSSTDFLGLLRRPFVRERAIDYAVEWGSGSYSFRHLEDYQRKHQETEKSLSKLLSMPAALLLESHPHLFSTLIQSLCTPETLLLKSNSFPLPFKTPAPVLTFQTQQIDHLKYLLQTHSHLNILVLIDSISIAGLSLSQIADIVHDYHATLIVDDTQSFGMLGKHGMGLSAGTNCADIIFGSFGKTFGAFASFIACSRELTTYLSYQNPLFYNLSPLPPFLLGLVDVSLSLIPSLSLERDRLRNRAKDLRLHLPRGSHTIKDSQAHILSLLFNNPSEKAAFKHHLTDHQCIPFHSPSHLQLDFFPTINHTEQDFTKFLHIVKSYRPTVKYVHA